MWSPVFSRASLTTLFTSLLLSSTVVSALNPHGHEAHAKLHHKKPAIAPRVDSPLQKGYKAAAYYVNWAIYARNSPPQDIPVSALTHVLYAFAGINNKTGEAYLTDTWADVEKPWDGDVAVANVTNIFGNLKQLYIHKKKNRGLKTILSIGGWTLRTYFAPALANESGRKLFAKSSVQLLKDLGFDGLEIDWEYPDSEQQSADLIETLRLFREELTTYSRNLTGNPHFLLTMAVPAGPDHYKYFNVPALNQYIDFINLMAYDYMGGGFSNFSGHAQNLYKSQSNPRSTDYDTIAPVNYYLNNGLPAEKMTLGMPIYGRSFAMTSGPGTKFGNTTDGSWEAGVWDYKVLPLNGSQVYTDDKVVASYGYNNKTGYMVSYDTPDIAVKKTQFLVDKQLGGAMWWETSGDHPITDSRSLIKTVTDELKTCGGLEQSQNVLDYPYSKYKNLRDGMPGQ